MTTRAVALSHPMEEAGYQSGDTMLVDYDGEPIETWLLVPERDVVVVNFRLAIHDKVVGMDHDFVQDPDDNLGGCKICWEKLNASETPNG